MHVFFLSEGTFSVKNRGTWKMKKRRKRRQRKGLITERRVRSFSKMNRHYKMI